MAKFFWHSLSARDRRALVVLAGAAALSLLLELVMLPTMDSAGKPGAALPLREKALHKYLPMVAGTSGQKNRVQEMQIGLAEAEKGLLSNRTPALAAAELQELIKQLMTQQGMEMRNAAFRPARVLKAAGATYSAVPLSLSFQCRLDQLTSFLLAAHGSRKVLALDQLSITAVPAHSTRPQKMVSVRMVIRGLMFAEPAPTPKS